MASSLASTSPSPPPPTATAPVATTISARLSHSSISFPLSPKLNSLRFFTKGCSPSHLCPRIKSQLNEVSLDGSSNAVPPVKAKSDVELPAKRPLESSSSVFATQESISRFITEVASLVKLVDSRDIVEFQMKQKDIELTIRKKEAMPQLQYVPQPTVMYSPPFQLAPQVAAASTSAAPTPSASASPPALMPPKSSHPPFKSPMAGTFYRSPGPAEPPFVNVGDKVKKGQVLCIIEAMKLMNEIESAQSGTIVDILVEDGKPVSVDMPLFVIEP